MTVKCPVCVGDDPELEAIFQRAITHILDFADTVIRERWQTDNPRMVDVRADWHDALVEGLVAATTEIAFRPANGDPAAEEQIAEDLRGMLASHIETALDDHFGGSMVQ